MPFANSVPAKLQSNHVEVPQYESYQRQKTIERIHSVHSGQDNDAEEHNEVGRIVENEMVSFGQKEVVFADSVHGHERHDEHENNNHNRSDVENIADDDETNEFTVDSLGWLL